eukprot:gene7495-11818_t
MSKFAKKNTTGNDALIMWTNRVCKPKGIEVKNIMKDWLDGLAFCAIVNFYEPELLDYDSLDKSAGVENTKKAFDILENTLDVEVYVDAEDAGKEKKTMMMCLGKIYEHFHTQKYFDKNQFQILTDSDSSPVTTQSPAFKVSVKEVTPKKIEKPKVEEDKKINEEPKPTIENSNIEEKPKGTELEDITNKYKELTEKYHDLQEKQATYVYGNLQYVMIIIFLVCLLVFFK